MSIAIRGLTLLLDLFDERRSFGGRQMGKKRESREKQQKGFRSKRSSRTDSQDDPARSSVVSLDDDTPSGGTGTRFVSVIIGGRSGTREQLGFQSTISWNNGFEG